MKKIKLNLKSRGFNDEVCHFLVMKEANIVISGVSGAMLKHQLIRPLALVQMHGLSILLSSALFAALTVC